MTVLGSSVPPAAADGEFGPRQRGGLEMNSAGQGDSTCLEYLYKEYVRLSGTYEASIKSSFDDIKLLGAIAVLLAWKPISDSKLLGSEGSSDLLLLMGFVAILVIVAVLAVRELTKQSLVN
jgi:hypothetical protein